MDKFQQACYSNALLILAPRRRESRRINAAYRALQRTDITAAIEDWFSNPFIRTALSILQSMTGSYEIREAVKLLKAAGDQAKAAKKPGYKPPKKRR